MKKIVITGASGNIGGKLVSFLAPTFRLVLVDKEPASEAVVRADLSVVDRWTSLFRDADAVVHLAANSLAQADWPDLVAPNVDAMLNVYRAAAEAGVPRFVFASSNHVMGGYKDCCGPEELTSDLPPRPGTRYTVGDEHRDSTPYAATKLLGERAGRHFAAAFPMQVVAVRIGWNKPGLNRWEDIPRERGAWFRGMWLSNRDCCHLLERCIEADLKVPFVVLNGMSDNAGMPWSIGPTRRIVGYEPQDGMPADSAP